MYGFLLVIKDSENPSGAVGLTKKAKEIPPYYMEPTKLFNIKVSKIN